jgi:hypothetical protein
MHPTAPVPIERHELEDILKMIQVLLKDDEAGPGFYITDKPLTDPSNSEEVPF